MAALALPQLSLDLPSTRVSVDFASFAIDLSAISTPTSKTYNGSPFANTPLPELHSTTQHRTYSHTHSLPEVKAEPEFTTAPSRRNKAKWSWRKTNSARTSQFDQHSAVLSRANSSASTASTASTAVASVFSRTQSNSTRRSSYSSSSPSSKFLSPLSEELLLSSLPLSLLEHILSYSLDLPHTVSVGPMSMEQRHMQYRYNPESLEYVDLRQVLKHPIFLVSRRIRGVSLDVFYRKCEFSVDLSSIYYTKVSSTINDNLKRHQKFWNEPPTAVKEALRNLSRLQIRLPVPSTEAGVRRGRDEDNWMDGSDGKGGGSWRVKSMKREQEDAFEIQKCLEAIVRLVMAAQGSVTEPQGLTRSLSSLSTVRRSRSVKAERIKSAEYNRIRGSSPDAEESEDKRKPLRRMEIVLVKRSPWTLVLSECLGLIRALRSVPVTGFTKYYFELNAQKIIWATKYRRKWQGMEPNGARLLQDLQGLTVAETPIEPIRTPTEFKFVKVDNKGQLRLLDFALPKTQIDLEASKASKAPQKDVPHLPLPATPKPTHRKPAGRGILKRKAHKRNDSFGFIMEQGIDELGSSGTHTSGRNHPPTVDELRKIAEDIRNGLY